MTTDRFATLTAGIFVVLSLTLIGPSVAGGLDAPVNAKPLGGSTPSLDATETPEVTIESEAPISEPTLERRAQKFRATLGPPLGTAVREAQLSDGILETTTRFGRLCARSLPLRSQNGPGGDTTLFGPCAPF